MSFPDYYAPVSLDEALSRLSRAAGKARIIAGGTDILPSIRAGVTNPGLLIDLRLLDLAGIRQEGDFFYLGSRVTHTQVLESKVLSHHYPALVAACREIGGPSIRNRGTLGGNLVNASPAADAAPPLLVYDADVLLVKDSGERWLPLDKFFIEPGQTALSSDEILKEIRMPLTPRRTAVVFSKLGKRRAMAIAVVSVAVRLTVDDDSRIVKARIALGSVATRPIRARSAEKVLAGRSITESLIAQSASVAAGEASPISDLRASSDYRRHMVEVLVRRTLISAWQELQMEPLDG
jgi:carbon-monoxide dehydrogenase medium subunit